MTERLPFAEALRVDSRTPPLIAMLQACQANQRQLARKARLLK